MISFVAPRCVSSSFCRVRAFLLLVTSSRRYSTCCIGIELLSVEFSYCSLVLRRIRQGFIIVLVKIVLLTYYIDMG